MPGGIRTPDLKVRSLAFYPAKLQAQIICLYYTAISENLQVIFEIIAINQITYIICALRTLSVNNSKHCFFSIYYSAFLVSCLVVLFLPLTLFLPVTKFGYLKSLAEFHNGLLYYKYQKNLFYSSLISCPPDGRGDRSNASGSCAEGFKSVGARAATFFVRVICKAVIDDCRFDLRLFANSSNID